MLLIGYASGDKVFVFFKYVKRILSFINDLFYLSFIHIFQLAERGMLLIGYASEDKASFFTLFFSLIS